MKLQHLAAIFILIIMPLTIIFSTYISNQVKVGQTEMEYDSKLLAATYDAIKSYQINTINNSIGNRATYKLDDVESAINIFYNSLQSSFGYTGYKSKVMDEYVPAVAFTLYDGYYIYQPYVNTLTGLDETQYDNTFSKNNEQRNGVKSYIYYNQRYRTDDNNDFVITYTLDNYIVIDGKVDGNYIYKAGYLMSGISKNGDSYTYDGITFNKSDNDSISEYISKDDRTPVNYVKIDGTKYYNDGNEIYYFDSAGQKVVQVSNANSSAVYDLYANAINSNHSAYDYFREAYDFTNWVETNIGGLLASNAQGENYTDVGKIFDHTNTQIQNADSNFYRHKSEVIRHIIESNLSKIIQGYNGGYYLPKISDIDWETIENNTCIISFMQGMPIGSKVYNGYKVVANSLTREFVDENSIYILKNDNTYCKPYDKTLMQNGKSYIYGGLQAGRLNIDFENKITPNQQSLDINNKYYPIRGFLASYTSIVGNSGIDENWTSSKDMYDYLSHQKDADLKKAYYTALARERMGVYNVNNGLKDEDQGTVAETVAGGTISTNVKNWFYLKNYK